MCRYMCGDRQGMKSAFERMLRIDLNLTPDDQYFKHDVRPKHLLQVFYKTLKKTKYRLWNLTYPLPYHLSLLKNFLSYENLSILVQTYA